MVYRLFSAPHRHRELFVLFSSLVRDKQYKWFYVIPKRYCFIFISFSFSLPLARSQNHSQISRRKHFHLANIYTISLDFSSRSFSLSISHFASGETHSLLDAVFEFLVDAPMNFRFIWEPRMNDKKRRRRRNETIVLCQSNEKTKRDGMHLIRWLACCFR